MRASQIITSLAALAGSVLLTLILLAGLGATLGYYYIDQRLAQSGIEDWQLSIGAISRERWVIDQLSLTFAPQPNDKIDAAAEAPLTLGQLLSYPLPDFLPKQVTVKAFNLRYKATESVLANTYQGQATFTDEGNSERLQLSLNKPWPTELTLQRQNDMLSGDIRWQDYQAEANYGLTDGRLTLQALVPVTEQHINNQIFLSPSQWAVSVRGQLPPTAQPKDAHQLMKQLSAEASLQLLEPITLQSPFVHSDVSLIANAKVSNGVVNDYSLIASGSADNFQQHLALPSDVSVPFSEVSWQLTSSDRLAVGLSNINALIDKTQFPIAASVTAKAGKEEAKAEFIGQLQQRNGQLEGLSGQMDASANILYKGDLINADTRIFDARFNIIEPQISYFDFRGKLAANSITLAEFPNLKAEIVANGRYRDQRLSSSASATLNDTIKLAQQSILVEQKLKGSASLSPVSWQQIKPLAKKPMTEVIPLLDLQSGKLEAQAQFVVSLASPSDWQVPTGVVKLSSVDGVYNTLAFSGVSASLPLAAAPKRLRLNNANLEIKSIQQGFAVGPVTAGFDARLPWQAPSNATLTLISHQINALGGDIRIPNQTYTLQQDFALPVVFESLSLGELMRQYPSNKVSIDGQVSGTLPLLWRDGELTLDKGYLNAVAPGGLLKVDSSALARSVGSNPSLQTLSRVLENFHYQELSSVINYDKQGTLVLDLHLQGYNPDVENGRTVKLNINLEEDLPALIKGIQLSNGLNDAIRKRLQKSIQ